jgi:hypothetical protein
MGTVCSSFGGPAHPIFGYLSDLGECLGDLSPIEPYKANLDKRVASNVPIPAVFGQRIAVRPDSLLILCGRNNST